MSTSTSLLFQADAPLPTNLTPLSHHTPLSEGHTPLSAHSGSPSRSPRRLPTDPTHNFSNPDLRPRTHKRIIVCCDGTWQDGISEHRSQYTNILRLARTINHEDVRNPNSHPIPQIVFYQSGIGTENNFYSEYIEGTTGGSLADKVEEAYAFIAHNYTPGDEIFLFGFSRGAYTARMVAMFVGEIGVLDRKDMDHFAGIFIAYQKLGKSKDEAEINMLKEKMFRWNQHTSPGKIRADSDGDTFSVQCVGVFDTVGSLGLPEELTFRSKKLRTLFGFPDRLLGEHIHRAYQALALNETRSDFNCNKFEQTEGGRQKGQVLKQCWFTGSHSDIGGGYRDHDLADLSLVWMAAQIGDILSLDMKYLSGLLSTPVAQWGAQKPHDPRTGIFSFSLSIQRPLPTTLNVITQETIHASVLEQAAVYPELDNVLKNHSELINPLLPLEEEVKINWQYQPSSPVVQSYTARLNNQEKDDQGKKSMTQSIIDAGSKMTKSIFKNATKKDTGVKTEAGEHVYERNQAGDLAQKAGLISGQPSAPVLTTGS
ncbi:hypothetical protein BDQ12DRAFT_679070 [Crucibulum laeve]|uniref:T6SS Phospholipase effector Tle1-like catalytic domain-containing protein n=1 Tax=Crucibulum laeve TaxID=68775 RepID=A0A5C3M6X9_9AGAR|nr:hypothetical protein BDQ12DRAFT_679070 [Crucibulum laeve]